MIIYQLFGHISGKYYIYLNYCFSLIYIVISSYKYPIMQDKETSETTLNLKHTCSLLKPIR